MSGDDVSVVLAHGAWADGSSWSKVIVAHSVDHMPLVTASAAVVDLILQAVHDNDR